MLSYIKTYLKDSEDTFKKSTWYEKNYTCQ